MGGSARDVAGVRPLSRAVSRTALLLLSQEVCTGGTARAGQVMASPSGIKRHHMHSLCTGRGRSQRRFFEGSSPGSNSQKLLQKGCANPQALHVVGYCKRHDLPAIRDAQIAPHNPLPLRPTTLCPTNQHTTQLVEGGHESRGATLSWYLQLATHMPSTSKAVYLRFAGAYQNC